MTISIVRKGIEGDRTFGSSEIFNLLSVLLYFTLKEHKCSRRRQSSVPLKRRERAIGIEKWQDCQKGGEKMMNLQRQESHQTAAFIAAEFLDYRE